MPEVACTVNTCKYWDNGNLCTAKQIIVQNDGSQGVSANSNLNQLAATPADSSDETCCQTFKSQGTAKDGSDMGSLS